MKSLLLGRRTNAPDSRESVSGLSTQREEDWFLSQGQFERALGREQRRIERSRKLLLLMLLDARRVLVGPSARNILSSILSTLSLSTRETDITGWCAEGSVIGVIFTEITEAEKSLIGSAILNRITRHLETRLSSDCVQGIDISLNFFPEDWGSARRPAEADRELTFASVRTTDSKRYARVLKRVVDVAGSSLALVATWPLFALIVLLIRLTSKGPAFFRQQRVGQGGRSFECLKFRTMQVGSDPKIHREYVRKLISGSLTSKSAGSGVNGIYKIQRDPRITPLGRLLRRTSLDELPQFWNVLKGEMSLVGPRPAIPYELESYDYWHRRRILDIKPGITGLWQVHGRSRTTFDEMVRLDLRYAEGWSIWLDLKILFETPKAMLSGEGAY